MQRTHWGQKVSASTANIYLNRRVKWKKNKKYTRTQQKMWREKEQKIILNIYPDRGGVPWDLIKAFLHAPTFEH